MREENSGGDVGYYGLEIKHPKRFAPCKVECEDVIRALGLNFFEGEAFKAIWRKGAQRTLGLGKAGNTALRDAQKMAHYGARELAHEEQRAATPTGWTRPPQAEQVAALQQAQWLPGDLLQGTSGKVYEFVSLGGRYANVIWQGQPDCALLDALTWVSRP